MGARLKMHLSFYYCYMKKRWLIALLPGFLLIAFAQAQSEKMLRLDAAHPIADVQPTMWGIFFEDINFAADGGLYAELVKNRSFEFAMPLTGWKENSKVKDAGNLLVLNRNEVSQTSNPRFVRVTVNNAGNYGIANEGFRGMGITSGAVYNFSVLARMATGSSMKLRLELVNAKGDKIGESTTTITGSSWQHFTATLTATDTDPKAKLNIWFEGTGAADIDMISLFPKDTWKDRPNGLRKDLVQLLADMKPGFIRFPGGCIVEGRELATRYQWKKTVGNVEDRELIVNRWNMEFRHRLTPDYYQSYGLGFMEYFMLAEDIGASPLPILNCGMACQFNTAEVVPVDQIDPYVQDALDLIEFANGDATTRWGKLRTELGHPATFNLTMMGVGNEQWGPQYIERYRVFTKAIKDKYPAIKLVNSTGTDPDGDKFNFLNDTLRKMNADILDEHYYRAPQWFLQNAARYDNYDRNGPKIFAGEYAAQSKGIASPDNRNNWQTALSEAAYMTGLERNAGIVSMASYAPLFAHVDAWQWTPDLIWFDNLHSYGTPNYYVQKLFSANKGTQVIPLLQDGQSVAGKDSLYASAVLDKGTAEIVIKVVNASAMAQSARVVLTGVRKPAAVANVLVLQSINLQQVNSLDQPKILSPIMEQAKVISNNLSLTLPPYSFSVVRLKAGW